MSKKETRERWQNLIMYVGANLESQSVARTRAEAEELHEELYRWLMSNFKLSRKRRKETIIDLMKTHKSPQS
jgi:hypothetical protein